MFDIAKNQISTDIYFHAGAFNKGQIELFDTWFHAQKQSISICNKISKHSILGMLIK